MKLTKNSGGAAIPRNKGLEFSRGKYIFFMDSDDVLTDNAINDFCDIAEKFQSDVCYSSFFLSSFGIGDTFKENIKFNGQLYNNQPFFITENLKLRIQSYFKGTFRSPPWLKFVSKNFLIENDIKFSPIRRDDDLWTLRLLLEAKKFVIIPNICVVRRAVEDSLTLAKRPLDKHFRHWLDRTVNGSKILNDFLSRMEFFIKHPEYKFEIINRWINEDIQRATFDSLNIPLHIVLEVFRNEFKNDLGEHETLISYLFTNALFLNRNLIFANQKIHELSGKLNGLK